MPIRARHAVALALLAILATGCLGGGTKASSTPPLDRTLIGDYAATITAVDDHLDSYAAGLTSCTSGTYKCIFDVISAGAAASFLVSHLAQDATLAAPADTVPTTLTTLVASTRSDAATVKKRAAGMTKFTRNAITDFRTRLSALTTDVDAWRTAGTAGRVLVADHIRVPAAPPPNLHVRFHVRPLIYIKQNPIFTTFTRSGSHCKGAGILNDLHRGAGVTIYDAGGRKVIGLGYIVTSSIVGDRCKLVADVKSLPPEPFYQLRITDHNKVAYSARELLTQSSNSTFG